MRFLFITCGHKPFPSFSATKQKMKQNLEKENANKKGEPDPIVN